MSIRLEALNAAGLAALVHSPAFRQMPVIPISTHRALSHLHNPRLQADDIIMILARNEAGDMLGYLGILPDDLYTEDEKIHAGWMSCIWVSPEARGMGLAKQMVARALLEWKENILATEFTPEALAIYMRSGRFKKIFTNEGIRLYLRYRLATLLPQKRPALKYLKPLLKISDSVLNRLQQPKLARQKQADTQLSKTYLTSIDEEAAAFITKHKQHSLPQRDAAELNWILHYPWVQQGPENEESASYHFTSVAKQFANTCIQLKEKERTVAVLLLVIKNSEMKVPYIFCEEGYEQEAAKAILAEAAAQNAHTLTVLHPQVAPLLQNMQSAAWHKRPQQREYIAGNALAEKLGKYISKGFRQGDGDSAFT